MKNTKTIHSSFRDPSGFLFIKDGTIHRQINKSYKDDYDYLMSSGLYESLVDSNLLLPHQEVCIDLIDPEKCYRIIKPEQLTFISYPYEWCFSQLKEAALATLKIQKQALNFGMSLKDCSAYNIQFKANKAFLIDTLSFQRYIEDQPWVAYRQFCQHFLGPLALMSYKDIRLGQLLRIYIDGVPLDLVSKILPRSSRFKFSLLLHIHFHANSQKRFQDQSLSDEVKSHKFNKRAMLGFVDSLENAIKSLKFKRQKTEWAEYYSDTNYTLKALQHKKEIVSDFLDIIKPTQVWDMGANVGVFSRIASGKSIPTIAFDLDHAAIEKSFADLSRDKDNFLLPLLMDLNNPSPSIGWANSERLSLIERGPTDTIMALALIHHLAISNNLPFEKIASFLASVCNHLIIEFIPKNDSQVQRLLAMREDIFTDYTQKDFEISFKKYFTIEQIKNINDSGRIMYLMKKMVDKKEV